VSGTVSDADYAALLEAIKRKIAANLKYPERERRRGVQGVAVLRITCRPGGGSAPGTILLDNAAIAETSGNASLDRAAVALVQDIFPVTTPGISSGTLPPAMTFTVSIRYSLQ
jgi:TonB family protein